MPGEYEGFPHFPIGEDRVFLAFPFRPILRHGSPNVHVCDTKHAAARRTSCSHRALVFTALYCNDNACCIVTKQCVGDFVKSSWLVPSLPWDLPERFSRGGRLRKQRKLLGFFSPTPFSSTRLHFRFLIFSWQNNCLWNMWCPNIFFSRVTGNGGEFSHGKK